MLLLPRRRFQKSLVGPEMVTGAVRHGPIGALLVGVHDLVIFVWLRVLLSHGADLLARHCDHCKAALLTHPGPKLRR